ncbi:MAG: erythromycin esterase family protein [Crocinitomicaceae bacterium]
MYKSILAFSFSILTVICFNQIEIYSIDPFSENNSDLNKLDSVFTSKRVIGLGESTHGTSEFTTMRLRIFKYLVEHHNYNTFFLEADGIACMDANRYVNGDNIHIDSAMTHIYLWPWNTEEFRRILIWMRKFNETNSNKLKFVGVDSQMLFDVKNEIREHLIHDSSQFKELYELFDTTQFTIDKDSIKFAKLKQIWSEIKTSLLRSQDDRDQLLIRDMDQWIYFKSLKDFRTKSNFRDSVMAQNIKIHLDENSTEKGIYFAHNAHVSRRHQYYKSSNYHRKYGGYYLSELIHSDYYCIGLDFFKGTFNALDLIDGKPKMKEFTEQVVSKKEVAYIMKNMSADIYFIPEGYFNAINKMKMNHIGAGYGTSSIKGYKYYRTQSVQKNQFDAFIIFRETSPSKLKGRFKPYK